MEQQKQPISEVAAYQAAAHTQAEDKADNRAYAIASLGFWAQVAGAEPLPAFDPRAVPEQPIPAALAAGYSDLSA